MFVEQPVDGLRRGHSSASAHVEEHHSAMRVTVLSPGKGLKNATHPPLETLKMIYSVLLVVWERSTQNTVGAHR